MNSKIRTGWGIAHNQAHADDMILLGGQGYAVTGIPEVDHLRADKLRRMGAHRRAADAAFSRGDHRRMDAEVAECRRISDTLSDCVR